MISTLRSLTFFLSFLLFSILSNGQRSSVPEGLLARFHQGEGEPWFLNDGRPDSLDILHYEIELGRTSPKEKRLEGGCRILAEVLKEGIEAFSLDLAGFKVQSVRMEGEPVDYERKKEAQRLLLRFDEPLEKGAELQFRIRYRGKPIIDPSGWGGTYFRKGYVFNLGVGFKAKPHSYGRTWFPCVDHFQERASYRFKVTAPKGEKAVCSGTLEEVQKVEGGKRYHWRLKKEVPAYLVSFAIGDYATLHQEYESKAGRTIPVRLDVPPDDSSKAVKSFAHLKGALSTFEHRFGPYRWPRVGYVAVPFPNGAMEHATNIAYPQASVNGTHRSDDLMSHELAHSWWGNLLTCATPWDMWINEGMASFSEFLFEEGLEGMEAYRKLVKKNHKKVLRSAHVKDGGQHRAIYGIPHEFTYGSHVYDKGADVVRTFRTILGDTSFFGPLKKIVQEHRYQNIPSSRLGSLWQRYSGEPMESYFEDWLYRPGFPHFRIRSYDVEQDGKEHRVTVDLEQRMTHTSEPYEMVPVELYFRAKDGTEASRDVMVSQKSEGYSFELPFEPIHVSADPGGKLAQAVLTDTTRISQGGMVRSEHCDAKVKVGDEMDPFYVQLRQHFIEPALSEKEKEEVRYSKARYWSVSGTFAQDDPVRFLFDVDGVQRKGIHPEIHFFDAFEKIDESELFVLHRSPNSEEWQRCSECKVRQRGSPSDGKAGIMIPDGMKGDFVLAGPGEG